jgi:hypothetical protein
MSNGAVSRRLTQYIVIMQCLLFEKPRIDPMTASEHHQRHGMRQVGTSSIPLQVVDEINVGRACAFYSYQPTNLQVGGHVITGATRALRGLFTGPEPCRRIGKFLIRVPVRVMNYGGFVLSWRAIHGDLKNAVKFQIRDDGDLTQDEEPVQVSANIYD